MSQEEIALEELASLEKRSISHTTHIKCAMCDEITKLSNRYKSPMRVENTLGGLSRVMFVCSVNGCEYDLTTCITQ